MANDRDASKQKRARQNRAQREAREARAKAAAVPASERQSKYASSGPKAIPSGSSKPRKGLFSGAAASDRERPERKPRPGDVPVDIETLEGNWFSKRLQVPGGRQVITGTVLTVVLSGMMLFMRFPPADQPKAKATESIFDLVGWWAIPIVLVPLLATLLATQFTLSPHRRRIWIGASAVVALEVALGFPVYLFPAGFLVYASVRSNKIEGPSPTSRAGRALAAQQAEASDAADAADDVDANDER